MCFVNTSWVDCPYCAESIEIVIGCFIRELLLIVSQCLLNS